jgi:SAM-dependent methyltransferase
MNRSEDIKKLEESLYGWMNEAERTRTRSRDDYSGYGQAHKTAITRRGVSAPVKYLISKGLLVGRVLDHGCGKGDICRFTDIPNAEQYDPTHHPIRPQGVFDTIYSGFVLNTMPEAERGKVINDIKRYLAPGGTAYIAVRRDVKKEGLTSIGSEQYNVVLSFPKLVDQAGKFAIYVMKG